MAQTITNKHFQNAIGLFHILSESPVMSMWLFVVFPFMHMCWSAWCSSVHCIIAAEHPKNDYTCWKRKMHHRQLCSCPAIEVCAYACTHTHTCIHIWPPGGCDSDPHTKETKLKIQLHPPLAWFKFSFYMFSKGDTHWWGLYVVKVYCLLTNFQ